MFVGIVSVIAGASSTFEQLSGVPLFLTIIVTSIVTFVAVARSNPYIAIVYVTFSSIIAVLSLLALSIDAMVSVFLQIGLAILVSAYVENFTLKLCLSELLVINFAVVKPVLVALAISANVGFGSHV